MLLWKLFHLIKNFSKEFIVEGLLQIFKLLTELQKKNKIILLLFIWSLEKTTVFRLPYLVISCVDCMIMVDFDFWVICHTRRYSHLWPPTSSSCGGLVAFGHLEGPLGSPLSGWDNLKECRLV